MKGATTYRANTNAPWRQQLHFPTHPMDAICVQNKSLHREPIRSAIAIQRVCWHEFKWRSEKDEVKELGKLAIAIRRAGRPQISTCRRICGTGFEFLFSFLFPVVDFLSFVGQNAPFSWPNHVIRIKNLLQNVMQKWVKYEGIEERVLESAGVLCELLHSWSFAARAFLRIPIWTAV